MPETKVRANGQVQLPKGILNRYGLKRDDVLEVRDTGIGIVIIPERIKRKMAKERIFELVKKEWARNRWTNSATLDRAINQAVRNIRADERERIRAGV